MNYDQAIEVAQRKRPTMAVSNAGGRIRYAKFAINGYGDVDVTLFSTIIATFHPKHVRVTTGGYNTLTTREALNTLLGTGNFWTTKRITHWHPYTDREPTIATDGMCIGYDGRVVREGDHPFPLSRDARAKSA